MLFIVEVAVVISASVSSFLWVQGGELLDHPRYQHFALILITRVTFGLAQRFVTQAVALGMQNRRALAYPEDVFERQWMAGFYIDVEG